MPDYFSFSLLISTVILNIVSTNKQKLILSESIMSEACSVNGMMPHLENKWRTDSSFTKVALQDRGNILNVKSKALIIEMKKQEH